MLFKKFTSVILCFCGAVPPVRAQIPQSEYSARREALAKLVGNGVIVAVGSQEPQEDYLNFRQNSNFEYLTGLNEPDAALVIEVQGGKIIGAPQIFVQPNDPESEVVTGKRLGLAGARSLGAEPHDVAMLQRYLNQVVSRNDTTTLNVVGNYTGGMFVLSRDDQLIRPVLANHPNVKARNANRFLYELRRIKSSAELDLIRKAADITVDAQRAAMACLDSGQREYQTQALIEYTFRKNGADGPSFATIVGSGPNSTILHYNANDRVIDKNDVVVMDIGAQYRGYAADVTRTIPASGKFSRDQRAIYQAVRDVQAAGERQAKLNAPAHLLTDSANAVMNAALAKLGLIDAPGATYDCDLSGSSQCPQYYLYYMHLLGHGIGLDVHDPGAAGGTEDRANLVPGSAFTIEPGIYVRGNLTEIIPKTTKNLAMIERLRPAIERYKNIGVRIEDDYIMSESGLEWISRAPREIGEIEALMATPKKSCE
jgi:Xaa-Pro aminopeptidase